MLTYFRLMKGRVTLLQLETFVSSLLYLIVLFCKVLFKQFQYASLYRFSSFLKTEIVVHISLILEY